jgi:hypothetical protein
MRFQIGAAVVTNKLLLITNSSRILLPEGPGTVLEVDEDDGGLVVLFDSHPNAIGVFADNVFAR